MKDWHGVSYHAVNDAQARDAIATINDYLFQLTSGIGRIAKGQVPDSSGNPLPFPTPDLTNYFYLPGRSGGQFGRGGTAASDFLKFSSTAHATKGKIYLGEAATSAYYELNDLLGIGQPTPLARLHVKVPTPSDQIGVPAADSLDGGYVNELGSNTDLFRSIQNTSLTTFNSIAIGAAGPISNYFLAPGLLDPGVTTGFQLVVSAKYVGSSGNSTMTVNIANNPGSTFVSRTYKITSAGTGGTLTTSYQTFTSDLTAGEVAAITTSGTGLAYPNQPFILGFSLSGVSSPPPTSIDIAFVKLIVPAVGGTGTPITLQKWEMPAGTTSLDFATDGGANINLALTGNTPLYVASGLGAASALRLYANATFGFLEVGNTTLGNTKLAICGTRASQADLIRIAATNIVLCNNQPGSFLTAVGLVDIVNAQGTAVHNLNLRPVVSQTGRLVRCVNSSGTETAGLAASGAYFLTSGGATGSLYTSDSVGLGAWATPSFSDALFRITNATVATKILAFSASLIASSTTRTLTVTNGNGTIVTDTNVTIDDTGNLICDDNGQLVLV